MSPAETSLVLARYRESAEGTSSKDHREANRWHDVMHEQFKLLRESEEGRNGIMALMDDPSPDVRIWAASHSLQWDLKRARATLESLRDSGGPCSFSAGVTLDELAKGRLNIKFDY